MRRLRALIRKSKGRIRLVGATGDPVERLKLALNYKTAASSQFPKEIADQTDVEIVLPRRYPFVPPKATVKTPIFHPNIYASGLVCLGDRWQPGEGLDLVVRRLVRLITLDPLVSGGMPPANQLAATWYQRLLREQPQAVPTETVNFDQPRKQSRLEFVDLSQQGDGSVDRTTVRCPGCGQRLRVPNRKRGVARCPRCRHQFGVNPESGG